MKKARTIIITIIVTAVCCSIMALVVVGSMFTERQTEPQEEPETTYFEYGTTIRSINMVSESAKYYKHIGCRICSRDEKIMINT